MDRFEELKACLILEDFSKFTDDYFIGSFLSGLTDNLQSFITVFQPSTLDLTINLGRKQIVTLDALANRLKPAPKPFSNSPYNFRRGIHLLLPHLYLQNTIQKILTNLSPNY